MVRGIFFDTHKTNKDFRLGAKKQVLNKGLLAIYVGLDVCWMPCGKMKDWECESRILLETILLQMPGYVVP
jgi:hypothetical protein